MSRIQRIIRSDSTDATYFQVSHIDEDKYVGFATSFLTDEDFCSIAETIEQSGLGYYLGASADEVFSETNDFYDVTERYITVG